MSWKSKTIPKLQNVEVIYFPAKTASLIQPLDAAMIAALKMKYGRKQVLSALSFVVGENKSIYNADQLTAMNWVHNIWQEINSRTIYNCWEKTGLIEISTPNTESTENRENKEKRERRNTEVYSIYSTCATTCSTR